MTLLYVILGLVIWFGCGFVAAGWYFAYFQGKYPELAERDKVRDSIGAYFNLFGGVAAFLSNCSLDMNRYGWKKWW